MIPAPLSLFHPSSFLKKFQEYSILQTPVHCWHWSTFKKSTLRGKVGQNTYCILVLNIVDTETRGEAE